TIDPELISRHRNVGGTSIAANDQRRSTTTVERREGSATKNLDNAVSTRRRVCQSQDTATSIAGSDPATSTSTNDGIDLRQSVSDARNATEHDRLRLLTIRQDECRAISRIGRRLASRHDGSSSCSSETLESELKKVRERVTITVINSRDALSVIGKTVETENGGN